MKVDILEVQPGFEVFEPAGNRIGDVIDVNGNAVHMKTTGLRSKELYIPPSAIAEVEEHRVELNVPKSDLSGRGWESPPHPEPEA